MLEELNTIWRAALLGLSALLPLAAFAAETVDAGKSRAFLSAQARQRDAETLKALSADGQLLYQRDRVKLDGYQYCSQAVSLAERGEFRQSIRAASKALHLGQQDGNEDLVAVSKRDLAIAYSYAGNLERAEQYAREALQHKSKDARQVAAPAYKILGDVSARRGNLSEAISHYEQASQAASDKFRPLVRISLANAYVADRQTQKAREIYQQVGEPDNVALRQAYRRGLGNLLLAEGKPAGALKLFSEALKEAEGTDAAYHRLWAQEGVARSHLALNDKPAAQRAYLDAARLVESVRARFRSEEFKTGLFGDVQRIFEQAIALSVEAGDFETAWALSESSRSRALLDVVRERVPVSRGAAALSAEPLSLAQTRSALREGEAIIEYHSLDDRLIAWVVRPGGIKGTVINQTRAKLDSSVDEFRKAIFERKRTAGELGERLHAILVQPLQLAANERLIFVPHGALHYMPFQALRDARGYLIERHPIAVTPSASVAVQLARQTKDTTARLVAFGNPRTDEKYALPGSEREVERIAGLFADKRIFLQREASKSHFREYAGGSRILHVAAHAEVDAVDPLFSRILLAEEDADSGFLEAREVYEINMDDVALVTISACESGLGRIARGDEMLGFTRSFLSAGASGLIVSLWPVADDSTELLMSTLYDELAKGVDVQQAMQAAQITVLKRARFSQPFFWAPFNLMGDWRLRVRG